MTTPNNPIDALPPLSLTAMQRRRQTPAFQAWQRSSQATAPLAEEPWKRYFGKLPGLVVSVQSDPGKLPKIRLFGRERPWSINLAFWYVHLGQTKAKNIPISCAGPWCGLQRSMT
jgi:hypothetical protein